jgi:hypothetical protein
MKNVLRELLLLLMLLNVIGRFVKMIIRNSSYCKFLI